MNTLKHMFRLVAIMVCISLIWSCSSDDETRPKVIKQVTYWEEVPDENNSAVNAEVNILFDYNAEGQLIKFTEKHKGINNTYEGDEDVFDLTYSGNKVTINKDGEYYGEYTLNSQGYAISFSRPHTGAYSYEYSPEGYLTKSTALGNEYTFTYEQDSLVLIGNGQTEIKFTTNKTPDAYKAAALFQPQYLHISGTVEVKVGFVAGLFGKPSGYLIKSTEMTIGKGQVWGYKIYGDYTYEFDNEGFVIKQTIKTSDSKSTKTHTSPINFVYGFF